MSVTISIKWTLVKCGRRKELAREEWWGNHLGEMLMQSWGQFEIGWWKRISGSNKSISQNSWTVSGRRTREEPGSCAVGPCLKQLVSVHLKWLSQEEVERVTKKPAERERTLYDFLAWATPGALQTLIIITLLNIFSLNCISSCIVL